MTTDAVSREEFEALRARMDRLEEDLEDLVALRLAQAAGEPDDYLPAELVRRMLDGEHPARIWREHRGLTTRQVADRARVSEDDVFAVEAGAKPGSAATLTKIAAALRVEPDDITA